ncbi:MAG: Outer membrane protein/peptidoglycan-associated (Lipo)protein [uncultured Aureispira sp.]|uniref:Outer membrane protein/peptidoglycan-associated (Lipo)protein n=1 Tax=uncultured Aureispira sp. TaxID=1331704 RepID=A0A6S6TQ40_9BACT|nr:MAG: Outer membrane protein/peptidoglycan-associated (Lipo)protein [uncultured Aureispira sp.]
MRLIYLWCCCVFSMQIMAQTSKHKNSLSYKFVLTDYNTLDPIYQASNPGRVLHAEDLNYAGEIGFFRNINRSLNLGLPLRIGSMDAHHSVFEAGDSLCQPCSKRKRNELFLGGDLVAVYKFNNDYLLKEDFLIAPYVLLGVGGLYLSQRTGHFDVQIPMGLGVNIKLTKLLYLQAQFEYRKSLVIQKDNFAISGGISWLLTAMKKSVPKE